MTGFILRRLLLLVPNVFGISLVTFILINLAVESPETVGADTRGTALSAETVEEAGRAFGLHLPMFVNLSIEDIRTRTAADVKKLASPDTRDAAARSLTRTGGAALPHLLPFLATTDGDTREALLAVLDAIGEGLGIRVDLTEAGDRELFWRRYAGTFGADFTAVRAKRLVRRVARRDDHLATRELSALGTFSLPWLMEALNDDIPLAGRARVADLLCAITGRKDPLPENRAAASEVIDRWNEWWRQRYDLYTSFDRFSRMTGAVTETRYFRWLARVVTFDFGISARDGRPIRQKIAERLPVTLLLSFLALLAAYGIAIPLGVISAVKQGTRFDRITGVLLFLMASLPSFWVAMILLRNFGGTGRLDWFPSQGLHSPSLPPDASFLTTLLDTAHHLVLPVLCLSLVSTAMLARYQRVGMLGIGDQNYIRTARAKGLSEFRVILRHGLRNGVIPVITLMGLQLPWLVSGSVVIERIFGIEGMGAETFEAIRASDYYWLLAVVTVTATLSMLGMLVSDVIHALVDPRVVPGRRARGIS